MIYKIIRYNLLLLILSFSANIFALDCVEYGTNATQKYIPIGQLAVPADTKTGVILWESDPQKVKIYCDNALDFNAKDIVHMYFNPKSQSLGKGLIFGAKYSGAQIERNEQRVSINGSVPLQPHEYIVLTVDFSLYIKASGVRPTQGYYSGDDQFTVFQFDGRNGINKTPQAKNLKYTLTGLKKLRFLKCGADINIYPKSQEVDFGPIMSTYIDQGVELKKQFRIEAVKKGCLDNFSINVNFQTSDKLKSDNQIDLNNGTVLSLTDDENNPIKLNYFRYFGEFSNGVNSISRTYYASIKKISELKLGPFSSSLIVKINYF